MEFSSNWYLFLIFLSGIGLSVQSLCVKILSDEGYSNTFECVFVRGFIQVTISLSLLLAEKERKNKFENFFGETKWISFIAQLRALCSVGSIGFAFLSVERLPLGDATVLMMMSPLYAAIMGVAFLGEPWRLSEMVSVFAALVGGVFVVRPPFFFSADGGSLDPIGIMFAFISSLSSAGAFICIRILGTSAKMPWKNICVIQGLGQLIMTIPLAYSFGQSFSVMVTGRQFMLMFTTGFVGSLSQLAMTIGMQKEKSAIASAMRMSDILFGFIWQVLFTYDAISYFSILGALLVSSSIGIMLIFKEKPNSLLLHDKSMELRDIMRGVYSPIAPEADDQDGLHGSRNGGTLDDTTVTKGSELEGPVDTVDDESIDYIFTDPASTI